MSGNKELVYMRFIEWLRKSWCDIPETHDLMPLIRARYTPQEAELLTGMPFSGKDATELSQIMERDTGELSEKLDAMARKGLVFRSGHGEKVRYSLNDAFFVFLRSSFWHGRDDAETKQIAPLINRYFINGFFDQYGCVDTKGLRTLPIGETIEEEKTVLPFEDVVKVLDEQDYFVVAVCPCRHRKNLDPAEPDCPHPTEVCLHFGSLGKYMTENSLGREISKEEAREILRLSAESGLVHGISNWKSGVDTICNCCKCCCMWFEAYHVLRHKKSMDASNYRLRTTPQTCKGCGLCTKRCPMEALHLEQSLEARNKKGQAAVVDEDKCIGCGVCAYKCPTRSLTLERRPVVTEPPSNPREYMARFLTDLQGARDE